TLRLRGKPGTTAWARIKMQGRRHAQLCETAPSTAHNRHQKLAAARRLVCADALGTHCRRPARLGLRDRLVRAQLALRLEPIVDLSPVLTPAREVELVCLLLDHLSRDFHGVTVITTHGSYATYLLTLMRTSSIARSEAPTMVTVA